MRFLLLFTALSCSLVAATDSLTVYEVDGASQTGRPVVFGRVFKQGEFASGQCAQPVVGGIAVTVWQNDIKNAWPDGSIKFAIVSFIAPTFSANSSLALTFHSVASSSACNGTGGLTQSQMHNYDTGVGAGSWGAQILTTDPTATVTNTADAKVMINALSAGDCLFQTWLAGPVVTQAIVQDCTATSAYDFGAHWDGTTMNLNSGAWYTGNNQYASLHPMFLLSFFSTANYPVGVEFILEDMWTGRLQDQKYSFVLKTGATPTQVYTSTGQAYAGAGGVFLNIGDTRWRKKFWSGTAPGHIRIDHNFPYLISTGALPNYDLVNASVSPDSTWGDCWQSSIGDYACFIAGDKFDIAGVGLEDPAFSDNNEGALVQREDLEYLYNMGTCGTVNGACAKAWDILTGEVDANASNTLVGVSGGAGMWYGQGQVPFHIRESSTGGGSFYCPGYTGVDATQGSATCGSGAGNTVGHGISRHAYPTTGQFPTFVSPVGTLSAGPNNWSLDCAHEVNWTFPQYLLTGDYFSMEENQQAANRCITNANPGDAWYQGNGFFVFPSAAAQIRQWTWSLQDVFFAAFISPDGTAESSYYNSIINSNEEIYEGYYGITGTAVSPTSPNTTCSGYAQFATTPGTATRWDFGHCGYGINVAPALHAPWIGACWLQDVYTTQSQITAATSASPTHLTLGSSSNIGGETVNIWGATSAWTALNTPGPMPGSGSYGISATNIDSTHVSVPVNATSFSQPLTGTVYATNGFADQTQSTDFTEPWQIWYTIAMLGRGVQMGYSVLSPVATEMEKFILEETEDAQSNPWFVALYETGAKQGTACSGGAEVSTNPFFSTWTQLKSSVVPSFQSMATFDYTDVCAAGGDHSYPLLARAASSYLPGITDSCSQGACYGANAWNWSAGHVPFYTASVAGSLSCPSGDDAQIKYAIAPLFSQPTITSPTAGATVSGTIALSLDVVPANTANVQWYVNGDPQGTAHAAPWTLNWNTNNVFNSSAPWHWVYAVALDATGTELGRTCGIVGTLCTQANSTAFEVSNNYLEAPAYISCGTITTGTAITSPWSGTVNITVPYTGTNNTNSKDVYAMVDGDIRVYGMTSVTATSSTIPINTTLFPNGAHSVVVLPRDRGGTAGTQAGFPFCQWEQEVTFSN